MSFLRRLRHLFRRRKSEAEMAEEMRFHLEQRAADYAADGLPSDEARSAAQRKFGNLGSIQERARDARGWRWLEDFAKDLHFGARQLARSPAFTSVAVFTLALGIGVNATIFSFVRDTLLGPLARDTQLNLVELYNASAAADDGFRHFSFSEFQALRAHREVFSDIAAQAFHVAAVGPENNLQRSFISFASENFFSLLGIAPAQGRFFSPEESQPGAALPVIVANYALWERLGRPADFIGSTLRVNQRSYTVIGITPPGFVGLQVTIGPGAWLPLGEIAPLTGGDVRSPRATGFSLVARLQPGLPLESARAHLDAANRTLNSGPSADPASPRRLIIAPPQRFDQGHTRPQSEGYLTLFSSLALGLSFLVLMVACLNLGNMLLARGTARQKEIAIRTALGASRGRIVRSLLTEGLLLALLGAAAGLVLGLWSRDWIVRSTVEAFATGMFVPRTPAFLDTSLLLATLGFSLIATVAFSLVPALRITRPNLVDDLKQAAGRPAPTRRGLLPAGSLPVIVQLSLSLALLFSAALFIRNSRNALRLDFGFQTAHQLVANVDYSFAKLDSTQIKQRQQELLAIARTLPGVERAALASNAPYSFGLSGRQVRRVDGTATAESATRHWSGYTAVTHDYFSTLGIALLHGRDFTAEESSGAANSRPVAIIDESLARILFGDADPVGHLISTEASATPDTALEVVGVVRSFRDAVFGNPTPRRILRPLGQVRESTVYLHLRTAQPLALVETLRLALRKHDPDAAVLSIRPFADYVEKNINMLAIQLGAVVFGTLGTIALVLAVVGVYGVKAYAVARRTREIGIRVALGARPRDVMSLILKQGAIQTAIGVGLGLALALLIGRALSGMLYSVEPADPVALVASATILTSAVLLACWLPARRAAKVDPLVAIRAE